MTRMRGVRRMGRLVPVFLFAAASLLVAAPSALGFSSGITKDNAGLPDFATIGCTACHGPADGAHKAFAEGGIERVSWSIADAEGNALKGNQYEHGGVYTITVTLNESVKPEAKNHAGFGLRASAGKFEGVDGVSKVSGDAVEATHTSPGRITWQTKWTAPEEGCVAFDLFVNDVDGSGSPDSGDKVYRSGFFLLDESHALCGAAVEHEVHYGIALQQYWIGLIGLAGMLFIMLAGFVYLKFVNPHNTDQKDR